MAQRQSHRGQHPEDARLFAEGRLPALRQSAADLSFLFSRDYAQDAALKLVGDHYQLDVRQRRAILRGACSEESLRHRTSTQVPNHGLPGSPVAIDGYNLLITVESALSGGVLLRGRDGCVRDMASIHGSYHKVEETIPAIRLIGATLQELRIANSTWFFDSPVSNSGRLKALLVREAEQHGWNVAVEVINHVDQILSSREEIVITSDSWILDRVARWATITDHILRQAAAQARVIDLASHLLRDGEV